MLETIPGKDILKNSGRVRTYTLEHLPQSVISLR
jgi:hypothetical protein